ncbi:MAG TPA: tetratricopeptide repeat protein [Thermoanaerobaculia bacterium]|jgi:tetratricopeptide (TPR) repeat protein|nr:tetratricopeptide repeat protein [Thermoanaerobaculia bacterium]
MADAPDFFLSHNSADKPLVREVAQALRRRGFKPWFDKGGLTPSRTRQVAEEAIKTCKAVAVFVGESGLGPWEREEERILLTQAVKRGLPVIPVLLPGAPKRPDFPIFLAERTWLDFRKEGITAAGIERLVWGMTGEKPRPRKDRADLEPLGPPPLHNLPYAPLGDLFKGRDDELRDLAAALQGDSKARAISQSARTLYGLGGIGKTRLAVEYAWRFGARYKGGFFVGAESPESLDNGLASLAILLDLPIRQAQVETVQAVLLWLQSNPNWLLILDNVDSQESERAVLEILPRLTRGHVLITSRLRNWPRTISRQELDTVSTEEAFTFLLERTRGRRRSAADDEVHALRLAKELEGLPLALEQAGAYIVFNRLSFSEYLRIWDQERTRVLGWHDEAIGYPASVATTWKASFDRLLPPAATLLRLMSFLAPEPIPEEMFEWQEATISREALAELESYSFISREGSVCTVHRLVQEMVQNWIPPAQRREWVEKALQLVNGYAPGAPNDFRTWAAWGVLRPHVAKIVSLADATGVASPTSHLMSELAIYLHARGCFAEAEPLMRRALAIDEVSFGNNHPNVAVRLNNLALLLNDTNRLAEAEPLIRRALAIAEAAYGSAHPDVATGLNNLAHLLQAMNRLAEAEPLMRRALAIDETAFRNNHPQVATGLNNLAHLLQAMNRLAEAEPLMRRALAIDEAAFGSSHPNVARDLNNLAQSLQAMGRPSEAEPLIRRALAIDETVFGSTHPNVARDLNNLAQSLQAMNHNSDAEPLLRRALAMNEAAFGSYHPNVAIGLNNLALLLQAEGRLAEAELLMRRAVAVFEASLGSEHPSTVPSLKNLGMLLAHQQQYAEARSYLGRAGSIALEQLGDQAPLTREIEADLRELQGRRIDPLLLAFRLVLGNFAPPDLLLSVTVEGLRNCIDKIPFDRGRENLFAAALEWLESQQVEISPNPLWLSWMRASRGEQLAQVEKSITNEFPSATN